MMATLGIDSTPLERPFRTAAAAGKHAELVDSGPNMTFIFNNGVPGVCYTYALPGKWGRGSEDSLYRSQDGPVQVGLVFFSVKDL